MKAYDTLSQAVNALQKEGYTEQFSLKFDCLVCDTDNVNYQTDDFEVIEVHRFEGMSNPSDNSVLYAIQASNGKKGTLIDAYVVYSDPISIEMIEKFQMPNRSKI